MEICVKPSDRNWIHGTAGDYFFEAKLLDAPSESCLEFDGERSRIINLRIDRGYSCICYYDRGWEKLPSYDEDKDACAEIIRYFI